MLIYSDLFFVNGQLLGKSFYGTTLGGCNISFINVTREYSNYYFIDDTVGNITIDWPLQMRFRDIIGNPIEGLSYTIADENGTIVVDGITGESGSTGEHILRQSHINNTGVWGAGVYNLTYSYRDYNSSFVFTLDGYTLSNITLYLRPQLNITSWNLTPRNPHEGVAFNLSFLISNLGNYSALNTNLSLYLDSVSESNLLNSTSLSIAYGDSTNITFRVTLGGGNHTLVAVVEDAYPSEAGSALDDNEITFRVDVEFDNRPPAVVLSPPISGEGFNGTFQVAWESFDPDGNIIHYNLSYRNSSAEPWVDIANELDSISCAWNISGLNLTRFVLRVSVWDGEFGTNDSVNVTVIWPNHAPRILWFESVASAPFHGIYDLSWESSDPDDDPLLTSLYYQNRSSDLWEVMAANLSVSTYAWNTSGLNLTNVTLRIVVSDGILEAETSTNISVEKVNARPRAIIDNVTVTKNRNGTFTVEMAGHGLDQGAIVAIEWYSDLSGFLGRGSPLVLYNLTPGTHNISLRVRDEGGLWSEDAAWPEAVVIAVGGNGDSDVGGLFGLSDSSLAILLVLVGAVVVGGTASWRYHTHISRTQIQPTLERLRSLTEQHRLAELEYPRDRFQQLLEGQTFWRYRSLQTETEALMKEMEAQLDLFTETAKMLEQVREQASQMEEAGLDYDRTLLDSAELAFKERRLEDAKWAAASFSEKVSQPDSG